MVAETLTLHFKQSEYSAAAAIDRARFAKSQNFVALHEPATHFMFQHRLAVFGAQAFAVDNAHAAAMAFAAIIEKAHQLFARLVAGQTVQVEMGLNRPAARL